MSKQERIWILIISVGLSLIGVAILLNDFGYSSVLAIILILWGNNIQADLKLRKAME